VSVYRQTKVLLYRSEVLLRLHELDAVVADAREKRGIEILFGDVPIENAILGRVEHGKVR